MTESVDSAPVSVGIVTYSDRRKFLARSLARLSELPDVAVYVVLNGTPPEVEHSIIEQGIDPSRLTLIRNDTNLGSAGGFAQLLERARASETPTRLLLLDDDNLLPKDWWPSLMRLSQHEREIFMLLRPDRTSLIEARDSNRPWSVLGSPNGFLGRDLFGLSHSANEQVNSDVIAAPYSGLVLPWSVLRDQHLPKRELFLYGDDSEFTYRLTAKHGYRITIIDDIEISDLETSFHLQPKHRLFSNRYIAATDFRTYYSVRNQIVLGRARVRHRFLFFLNSLVFFILFSLQFVVYGRWKRLRVFAMAVTDGFRWRTGVHNPDRGRVLQ